MSERAYLSTGQMTCHNTSGTVIPCGGSGQDADFKKGIHWPNPRFTMNNETVTDLLTGLTWTRQANMSGFPMRWQESIDYIKSINERKLFGFSDWRLPNRRELRSLISYQTHRPALPENHPFLDVFQGWYWTSTSAAINPAFAWYIHLEGARMFYGRKDQFFLAWPVRGQVDTILSATGQKHCFDREGNPIPCNGSGQDGEFRMGIKWPEPRFEIVQDRAIDWLTNLCWSINADIGRGPVTWQEALYTIVQVNLHRTTGHPWRLPNINELESLVDCSNFEPALPAGHPFIGIKEGYWSSTTSMFEPDWAWALYLNQGAVGVGQKRGPYFHVWPVSDLP